MGFKEQNRAVWDFIECQVVIFTEFADSNAKFYCRVYYAEYFRKVRSIIFPEGEER